MWFRPQRRRSYVVSPGWSRIENLESRALLSATAGSSEPVAAEVSVLETSQTQSKAAVMKTDFTGTYPIFSNAGNTGTYTVVQEGLTLHVTVNTVHYPSGSADLHLKNDHSKRAKGTGEFHFAGEAEPQPVALKIKFKTIDGELRLLYKYHTFQV
jgi:hypothetical protein